MTWSQRIHVAAPVACIAIVATLAAQQRATPKEFEQAAAEAPQLAQVLDLGPGMVIADIGAGFGALTVALSSWLGPAGRIFASDITPHALAALRAEVSERGLANVTVLQGDAAATNLPPGCCDAIVLRDVYHHLTSIERFNRSVHASLKPQGRLAIIDFAPDPGSELPRGVPANRGGHGIRPELVIEEVTAMGFAHVRTIPVWPPETKSGLFLVLFRRNEPGNR
jgi:predicted methyltransferase